MNLDGLEKCWRNLREKNTVSDEKKKRIKPNLRARERARNTTTQPFYIKKRPWSMLCNFYIKQHLDPVVLFFFKGKKIFYVQEAQADMDSGAERNIAVPAPVLHPYP